MEMSFQNLIAKTEAERRDQELLNEVKKKEREASQTVKMLDAELDREYAEHEKETKSANQEIKELGGIAEKQDNQRYRARLRGEEAPSEGVGATEGLRPEREVPHGRGGLAAGEAGAGEAGARPRA